MKKSIFTPVLLVVLLMATSVKAQMGIGTATPHSSAQLDVSSVLKGFLAPRMTLVQRNAVATPAEGLLVYQTDNTPGFYYYNGTAWVALSGSGGSAGVDLTTAQSVGGLKTFTSVDGLLATGGGAGGVASSLGAGTRMMWYPKNAAFRAGYVSGTQWDDANIGLFSIAMGNDTKASNQGATAMGYNTLASGPFSTAMGSGTTASGTSSIAMGENTKASGSGATAMGFNTLASGYFSTAMGSATTASQTNTTAMGYNTLASGLNSTAMGNQTTASGSNSIAIGSLTTAKSFAETAIGLYNTDYTPISSSINSSDRLFVIGNGTSNSARSDALVMLKDGTTTFGGSVAVNGNGTGTSYTLPTTRGTANYVLTTDGVGGTSWAAAASGGGGAAGVDLTTAQSVGGLKTFTSVDGLLATGGGSGGVASSLGAGTRMMWYPKNAAFRAGYVSGTQWDDANIGLFSIAMGGDTKASGQNATAMGYNTLASGLNSTATGNSTTASADYATAMGINTTASADYATAMGKNTTASGPAAIAMGNLTTASAISSTAMGSLTTASGIYATAMGADTYASGRSASAMGEATTASGDNSTVMGVGTTSRSYGETTIGFWNTDYTPSSKLGYSASDRLFVIGNGAWNAKSNALVMLKDGTTTFGGSVAVMGNGTGTSYTLPTTRGTANYVLTTDGVGGTSWAAAASGGGGAAGVDLTTAQSVGGLKTFNSVDGLLATGTFGSGTASSLGGSTRMMWYPKKAAFRAGHVVGTYWDDASIGNYSTAMGYNTQGGGNYSTAMGHSNTATGEASTAMGYNNAASGQYSTAMGSSNVSSNYVSVALGSATTASGSSSTAMGSVTTASGDNSTAMGTGTTARSGLETTLGMWNTDYTPSSTTGFSSADRLFVIGNGKWNAKSDALVMLKNGNTTFSGTVTATVVAPTSDARLKRNIVPLKNSIEAIMQLKPVSYEKKNSLTSTEYNIKENGFIAQELQKVMPSLVVMGTDKDKLLSVNYTAIIPVLTQAIQEQQRAIKQQQANIKSLEKTAEEQQIQIVELKKMVELLMKK